MNSSNNEIKKLQNALINIAGYFTNIDIPELTPSEERACKILENMKVLEKVSSGDTFLYRMNHRDEMLDCICNYDTIGLTKGTKTKMNEEILDADGIPLIIGEIYRIKSSNSTNRFKCVRKNDNNGTMFIRIHDNMVHLGREFIEFKNGIGHYNIIKV